MTTRSLSLRAVAVALVVASCGGRAAAPKREPRAALHLEPACDLAAAAGLSWLVDVKPRAIAEVPDLIPAIALVLPEERLQSFAVAHGGVDLRSTKELCIAHYRDTTLSIARTSVDPDKVSTAFEARSSKPVTRTFVSTSPRVVRLVGGTDAEPERVLVFDRESVALERGAPGPLRAAEAFAFERLKKASPALHAAPLEHVADLLGDAPIRAFAPGPFQGESARGLGGLLGAATAVGASARWAGKGTYLAMRIVLTGAWGDDPIAAKDRFLAAANVVANSGIGRLFGLDRPVVGPTASVRGDALVLDVTIDGAALARGIHDGIDADVVDMMRH